MAKKKAKKKTIKKQKKKTTLDPFGGGTINRVEPPKVTPYPAAGKKITDFENKLDEQIADEKPTGKSKRGRPRKETISEPEFAMTEDIIRQTIKMPFDLWAVSQKLDELKLEDKEAAAIAIPIKHLLDYYLPKVPIIAIAWISLAVASYSIMASRLFLIAELKKENIFSSSDSVNAKDAGHGSPRSPDLSKPAGQGDKTKIEFPAETEPVKI